MIYMGILPYFCNKNIIETLDGVTYLITALDDPIIFGAHVGTLEVGDKALVKKVAFGEGKHKLADRWESDVYVVLRKPNEDIPLYTVQAESGEGRKRTLHRNLLLPIGYISQRKEDISDNVKPKPVPRPRTRATRKQKLDVTTELDSESHISDSTEVWVPQRHTVSNTTPSVDVTGGLDEPTLEQDSEPDGDAHSVRTVEPDSGSIGSASSTEDDDIQSDTKDEQEELLSSASETQEHLPVETSPAVVPRRSGRAKSQPQWLRSGDYVTKSAVASSSHSVFTSRSQSAEWQQKANCLSLFVERGLFTGIEAEAGKALVSILKSDH